MNVFSLDNRLVPLHHGRWRGPSWTGPSWTGRGGTVPGVGGLGDFPGPVGHIKVDETKREALWCRLVRERRYLGCESVIGSRVECLVALGGRVVGAISFRSGACKLGPRDKFAGWDEAVHAAPPGGQQPPPDPPVGEGAETSPPTSSPGASSG